MAVSTTLKHALRRIAGALGDFARDNKWSAEDYRIYYWINSKWEKIHIIFIARDFENRNSFQNYVMVSDYLDKKFTDDPDILSYLGLVVRSPKQVEEGGIYAIGPEYREFRTLSRR